MAKAEVDETLPVSAAVSGSCGVCTMVNSHSRPDQRHAILVFKHRSTAEKAVDAFVNAGVRRERISFFMRAPLDSTIPRSELDRAIDWGGALGAGLGVIAGVGLVAIPGVGLVVGTGTVAGAVAAAIFGGSVGGVAGALVGAGITEADAMLAEHHLREGKALVVVQGGANDARLFAIARALGSVELARIEDREAQAIPLRAL